MLVDLLLSHLIDLRKLVNHFVVSPLLNLVLRIFALPQIFLYMLPFLHPFPALLLLAVLVPEAVEEHIFDLTAGVVLSDRVQVRLGLVARDLLHVVKGQDFDDGLEGAGVFGGAETVVERPADDRQNDCLDTAQLRYVHAVFDETENGAAAANEAVARSEGALTVSATAPALEEAVEGADADAEGDDAEDDESIADDAADDGDVVLGKVELEVLVAAQTENLLGLDDLRGQAVGVHDALRTRARLDELGGYSELR